MPFGPPHSRLATMHGEPTESDDEIARKSLPATCPEPRHPKRKPSHLRAFAPADEIEAMIAAQALAVHHVASPSWASSNAAKQRSALLPRMLGPGSSSDSGRLAEVRTGPSGWLSEELSISPFTIASPSLPVRQ